MHVATVQLRDNVTLAHIQLRSAMCELIKQFGVVLHVDERFSTCLNVVVFEQ